MKKGRGSPNYGSHRRVMDGYVFLWNPEHPTASVTGYAAEHRVVAWDAGMLTNLADHTHHRNGIRHDNRLENLEVLSCADHTRRHAEQDGVSNQYGKHFPLRPDDQRPKAGRLCVHCGEMIAETKRRDALYCTPRCRTAFFKYRRRLRPAVRGHA